MLSVCLCILSINFSAAEAVIMKLGMYIMPPEPLSTAYFINPSHQSVCLCVYPPIVARQGLCKTLKRQRIHTQQKKNCWTRHFLCGPCRIKESRGLVIHSISSFCLHFPLVGVMNIYCCWYYYYYYLHQLLILFAGTLTYSEPGTYSSIVFIMRYYYYYYYLMLC
jgi:hypothetical protein